MNKVSPKKHCHPLGAEHCLGGAIELSQAGAPRHGRLIAAGGAGDSPPAIHRDAWFLKGPAPLN